MGLQSFFYQKTKKKNTKSPSHKGCTKNLDNLSCEFFGSLWLGVFLSVGAVADAEVQDFLEELFVVVSAVFGCLREVFIL